MQTRDKLTNPKVEQKHLLPVPDTQNKDCPCPRLIVHIHSSIIFVGQRQGNWHLAQYVGQWHTSTLIRTWKLTGTNCMHCLLLHWLPEIGFRQLLLWCSKHSWCWLPVCDANWTYINIRAATRLAGERRDTERLLYRFNTWGAGIVFTVCCLSNAAWISSPGHSGCFSF